MTFTLTTLPPDGKDIPVAMVRGDVDVTSAAELRSALAGRAGPALVVDLSEAGYFDSAGFAVLDDLLGRLPLAIVVVPGSLIRTAMALMNVPFCDSVRDARAVLRTRVPHKIE